MLLLLISTTGLEVLAVLQASGCRQHPPTRIYMDAARGREESKTKWVILIGKLAFPYQNGPAGSCHPLLWGLRDVVCPGGSAVATSSAAFLEIHEDLAPKPRCQDVAMCLLTNLCLKEQHRPVVSRPLSQQLLWPTAVRQMLKCNSWVGLKFN